MDSNAYSWEDRSTGYGRSAMIYERMNIFHNLVCQLWMFSVRHRNITDCHANFWHFMSFFSSSSLQPVRSLPSHVNVLLCWLQWNANKFIFRSMSCCSEHSIRNPSEGREATESGQFENHMNYWQRLLNFLFNLIVPLPIDQLHLFYSHEVLLVWLKTANESMRFFFCKRWASEYNR